MDFDEAALPVDDKAGPRHRGHLTDLTPGSDRVIVGDVIAASPKSLREGKLAVEGLEKRVWVVPHPTEKGRIKSAPIPKEIVAALSDATGATKVAP